MKNTSLLILISFVTLLVCSTAMAEKDPVLAKIGDIEVRQSDVDHKIEEIPSYARQNFETVEGQRKLLDRILRTKLLMKAAMDQGYAEKTEIKHQITEATERILSSAYFQDNMSVGPLPDMKSMEKYYEENKEEMFRTEATVEARHIVVETEKTGEEVKEMLDNGELTFEKAVEIYSTDQSKESGGSLGVLRENGFIRGIGRSRPFIEMIFDLKANEISDPFKTRQGYHLVQLLKKTNAGYQDFQSVQDAIARELLVSKEEINRDYIANQADYSARARCKLSHILLNTEEEAENVFKEIQSGRNFEALVDEYSIDQQSQKQQGNLGYLYKGGYIRGVGKDVEFEKAVFKLSEGSISNPIKSRKGWHIIKVVEKEDEAIKPLIEVEEQIRQKLIKENKDNFLENSFKNLEKKYNTQIFEDRIKAKN